MDDHRLAVGADLDVELDAVAGGDRRLERGAAVLDPPAAVQPAMGERAGRSSASSLSLP